MTSKACQDFEDVIERVQGCALCPEMVGCTRVLSWANGSPDAKIMFIGEAPGRLGADRTAIPFHGDVSGDNFEKLIQLAGLSRREVFVTNAVLCNPRDDKGNNAPPSRKVVKNCAKNLKIQIDAVQPKVVVTLGASALGATKFLEDHNFTLSENVRTANDWLGRTLVPLYHPGARAMIHRNFAAQTADYYFVGEILRRADNSEKKNRDFSKPSSSSWEVVRYIIQRYESLSLFKLHKTMYLLDFYSLKEFGKRFSNFVYIRQKDGPYCVELGSRWFKAFGNEIQTFSLEGKLHIRWVSLGLFQEKPLLDEEQKRFVDAVLDRIGIVADSGLKSRVYLTEPMKASLLAERAGVRQLNRPLL
ncbi:uracil-DNA glycosylase family protein [Sphingopyxis soli]|uniref:uracil-DNA glycosylase family protein n=1 Tax=Sphingopyxis soli TaxID=592051 RepID=UPI001BFE9BB1|nr:uracil-DNA glycosylase family protein [Sphingopyxis soli]